MELVGVIVGSDDLFEGENDLVEDVGGYVTTS